MMVSRSITHNALSFSSSRILLNLVSLWFLNGNDSPCFQPKNDFHLLSSLINLVYITLLMELTRPAGSSLILTFRMSLTCIQYREIAELSQKEENLRHIRQHRLKSPDSFPSFKCFIRAINQIVRTMVGNKNIHPPVFAIFIDNPAFTIC